MSKKPHPSISFKEYKTSFRRAIRQVLADSPPRSLDEAAFPAYAHSNKVINWLFWKRIEITNQLIVSHSPYQNVLDFGCGSGVMLPILAQHSQHVHGIDIDLKPFDRIKSYITFPANVQVTDTNQLGNHPSACMDLILALDVLEHVPDLPATMDKLMYLLKPGSLLIISGPTENYLYQLGRKLAGKEFSGAYHERGVHEIINLARQRGDVQISATLFPPFPLFQIFTVKKL